MQCPLCPSKIFTEQHLTHVSFFPMSSTRSTAQLPDNDTYCGDINAGSKRRLLHDISAGVNKHRQAYYGVNTARNDYLHQPLDAQQTASSHQQGKTTGKQTSFIQFGFASACVSVVRRARGLLRFHFRLQNFQLISIYKAGSLHNY